MISELRKTLVVIFTCATAIILSACGQEETATGNSTSEIADTIIHNANVYSFSWNDPNGDGVPAADAPYKDGNWSPDAQAVAIKDGDIIFVGTNDDAMSYRGDKTEVLDVNGAYVMPGFHDAHMHAEELGEILGGVDLNGTSNEEEAIERIVAYAEANNILPGEWILGRGWDEGEWADHLPNEKRLSELSPDNPVFMNGATGFGVWGNKKAMELSGFDRNTPDPEKGNWLRYEDGELQGVGLDGVVGLWRSKIPPLSPEQHKRNMVYGMQKLAEDGFTMVHQAGTYSGTMTAMEELVKEDNMAIRVYAMVNRSDFDLIDEWEKRGPTIFPGNKLFVTSVKSGLDGTIGVRSARMIEEYSDMPGHTGVDGDYSAHLAIMDRMIRAGFQINIHAIGDLANRESLEFYERHIKENPDLQKLRHRVEHASIIHPDDYQMFIDYDVIASAQPPFVAEDPVWGINRIGPERAKDMYAWRKMRRMGIVLAFGSDYSAYEYDLFYGVYSAIMRRNKQGIPEGGFMMEEALTSEETIRGYTNWAAYAAHVENETGTIEKGKWADLTIVDVDMLNVGQNDPIKLLDGKVVMTVVGGDIAYRGDY